MPKKNQQTDTTPSILPKVEANIMEAQTNIVTANANAKKLAEQIGYDGVLTTGALEDGIRFYQNRTVETLFEVGRRLLLLKEICPHGEFTKRVEILGLNERVARRYLSVFRKFAKTDFKSVVEKIGTQGKLLELLVLDDDEAESLVDGENVRGVNLDDIACMPPSELRAKLRESIEETESARRVTHKTAEELTKLKLKNSNKVGADVIVDWNDKFTPLFELAEVTARDVTKLYNNLRKVQEASFTATHSDNGVSNEERSQAEPAMSHLAEIISTTLARIAHLQDKELDMFANTLGAFLPDDYAPKVLEDE